MLSSPPRKPFCIYIYCTSKRVILEPAQYLRNMTPISNAFLDDDQPISANLLFEASTCRSLFCEYQDKPTTADSPSPHLLSSNVKPDSDWDGDMKRNGELQYVQSTSPRAFASLQQLVARCHITQVHFGISSIHSSSSSIQLSSDEKDAIPLTQLVEFIVKAKRFDPCICKLGLFFSLVQTREEELTINAFQTILPSTWSYQIRTKRHIHPSNASLLQHLCRISSVSLLVDNWIYETDTGEWPLYTECCTSLIVPDTPCGQPTLALRCMEDVEETVRAEKVVYLKKLSVSVDTDDVSCLVRPYAPFISVSFPDVQFSLQQIIQMLRLNPQWHSFDMGQVEPVYSPTIVLPDQLEIVRVLKAMPHLWHAAVHLPTLVHLSELPSECASEMQLFSNQLELYTEKQSQAKTKRERLWAELCPMLAFLRTHRSSPLRYCILPLLRDILDYADLFAKSDGAQPPLDRNKMLDTRYLQAIVYDSAVPPTNTNIVVDVPKKR